MSTKSELAELTRLVRLRERVAKSQASARAAELLAEFEAQVATDYHLNDEQIWEEAYAVVEAAVKEGNARVLERCRELGIQDRFAPSMGSGWSRRGEHASKERVAELRKVAKSRIDALEKAARLEIERRSVEAQTVLIAGGLESDEARAFLESLPTADELMPPLTVAEIEAVTPAGRLAAVRTEA